METTWYSDMGALIVAPFKRGIPQIVEHGSCKKGFYATAAFALVSFLFSNILPTLVSMIFADKLEVALTGAAALSGIGILGLASIFSWVANNFDAHTTYESVLKIMWYEQAYNQIMGLFYFLGILLISVPFIVILGFNPDSTVLGIVWITMIIFASIAFAIFTFWVCLTMLSRQINKSLLATFGISCLTSLIPVIVIVSLFAIIALASSR